MSNELKPCPFCGSKTNMMSLFGMTEFKCNKCGALTSFVGKERKAQAIETWNRRADNGNIDR